MPATLLRPLDFTTRTPTGIEEGSLTVADNRFSYATAERRDASVMGVPPRDAVWSGSVRTGQHRLVEDGVRDGRANGVSL